MRKKFGSMNTAKSFMSMDSDKSNDKLNAAAAASSSLQDSNKVSSKVPLKLSGGIHCLHATLIYLSSVLFILTGIVVFGYNLCRAHFIINIL